MWWRVRGRKRRNEDLDEEIAHDLMLDAEERVRDGASREEAALGSRKDFGNVLSVKEATREAWGWAWLQVLAQDLRYAARTLRRSPGFAVTAIIVLALAIGVNTAIFSIFDQVAFRPLPVKDGDRLVGVYETLHGRFSRNMFGNMHLLSYPELQYYSTHNHVFTGIAADAGVRRLTLTGSSPEVVSGLLISQDYFRVLDAHTVAGRTFLPEEYESRRPVAVLSYRFWQRRFGADPAIVGKTIRLNQTIFTVTGVITRDFVGREPIVPDVWMPIAMQPEIIADVQPRNFLPAGNLSWLSAVGRLKPGVTAGQAQADLTVLASQLDKSYPGRITEVDITPGTFLSNPESRKIVLIAGSLMLLAVALVLLVACANVANLLLARAAVRRKEIAVRLSVGATRGRLIRQLLTESALISVLGGALGLLLARWALQAGYAVLASRTILPPVNLNPDGNVLAYTLLLSAAGTLVFGLLPALHATNPDLSSGLKDEGSPLGRRVSKARLRSVLISVQFAVCMVLLLGAGLLVRGLMNAQTLKAGLHLNDFFITSLYLRTQGYDDSRAADFYRQLMAWLDERPGVRSALTINPPFAGVMMTDVAREGQQATDHWGEANFNVVSANYFDVMGIGLIRGRAFTAFEMGRGDPVAVISEAMAKTYWSGRDPLGQRFAYGARNAATPMVQVIGIAKDVRSVHIWEPDGALFYLPANPNKPLNLSVVTRTAPESAPVSGTILKMAHALDLAVLVSVRTLSDNVEHESSPSRIGAALAAMLGGLALIIASVGIYGVMTYAVSQRTREIGIRLTLGADRSGVLRLILTDNMRPVLIGMAGGLALAALTSRVLSRMLLGISPLDPTAFLVVAAFLSAVALLASYLPARRAIRIDPAVALRYE